MNITQRKISDIKPYEANPRKNDKAVGIVKKSLEQYGWQQPIVVDKDGVIVAGHTRYRAAKELNMTEVPVLVAYKLTKSQLNAYRIMDNKSAEYAQWDDDKLFNELKELLNESEGFAELSDKSGFTESELEKMFADPSIEDILTTPVTPRTKVGDLWTLGEHKILCGSSTEPADVARLMGKDKVSLIWEDPPYGVSYVSPNGMNMSKEKLATLHRIENDDLNPEELFAFLNDHLQAVKPFIDKGCPVYWSHDIRFNSIFSDALIDNGFHIADVLIWKKNNLSTFTSNYFKIYEPIIYGWIKGGLHNWYGKGSPNCIIDAKLKDKTKDELIEIINSMSNVQEVDKEPRSVAGLHPTVKPVKLIIPHIINSSRAGEIVYDGFSGSGSTLIAAERTKRQARCVEFEPKFVDVTIQRWQEETGLQAVREDGMTWDEIVMEELSNRPNILAETFNMEP